MAKTSLAQTTADALRACTGSTSVTVHDGPVTAVSRWSWKESPALMERLRAAQNHPCHEWQDLLTIVGFFASADELERHVVAAEAHVARQDARAALDAAWGREWLRLTAADQALLVRDCTEEGGVSDFAQYRRDIGAGNLQSYALTQRVRFKVA